MNNKMIDYKGIENLLNALNNMLDEYNSIMLIVEYDNLKLKRDTRNIIINKINDRLIPEVENLYLMVQNDDNVQTRVRGIIRECNRFMELFNDKLIKCFHPYLYNCLSNLKTKIQGLVSVAPIEEQAESKPQPLPDELNTDKAKKWLKVAIDGGLLNEDWTLTDRVTTKPQKALLAEILSDKIGINNKYVHFERIWNVERLAQVRWKSKENVGKVRGGEHIERVFE